MMFHRTLDAACTGLRSRVKKRACPLFQMATATGSQMPLLILRRPLHRPQHALGLAP